MNLFPSPTSPAAAPTTTEAKLAATLAELDGSGAMVARVMLAEYNRSRNAVYKNRFGLTPEQIYGALEARQAGDAVKLGEQAQLTKAVLNFAAAHSGRSPVVVDVVPEYTLTAPSA